MKQKYGKLPKCKTKGLSLVFMSGKYVSASALIRFMSESRNISYGFLSRTKNMCAAILFVVPLIFYVEGYIQGNIVITKCKLKKNNEKRI